jgi:hypothetical protein
MPTDNIEMLQTVADGLKELKDDIVFVGGAVAELYADEDVKNYLKTECERLFANDGLSEGIESALPYGSESDRVEIIEGLILEIASLD